MKNHVEKKTKSLSIKSLKLDPHNPRIKLVPGGDTERQLIARLCALNSAGPHDIVKKIKSDGGFMMNFAPVVLKDGRHFIVKDGNRRVAALKMILDPNLIPSSRRGLKNDCEEVRGLVEKNVTCWWTASKINAARIVYRAHTEGSQKWESLSRYSSHYDSYNEGQTLNDIASYTGTEISKIRSDINTWITLNYLANNIPSFILDSSGITNFERGALHYGKLHELLGFTLNSDGVFEFPNSQNLAEILNEIYLKTAKETNFSRNVPNNDKARKEFLEGIVPAEFKPKTAEPTKPNPTEPSPVQPAKTSENENKPKPAPPKYNADDALFKDPKIVGLKSSSIYKELKSSQAKNSLPIIYAALTRAFIENYLKHIAKEFSIYSESKKSQNKDFSSTLPVIAEQICAHIKLSDKRYSADLSIGIKSLPDYADKMNQVMHKDSIFEANKEAESAWKTLSTIARDFKRLSITHLKTGSEPSTPTDK